MLAGVLGVLLVACGTSTDEDTSRIETVKIDGSETGGPSESGESEAAAEPLQISPGATGDELDSGLRGPEFYRGSGILARGGEGGSVDVGVGDNGRITLNFANAQIRDVIDVVLGDTLNANYIIDPSVQGQVTVRTSQPLSRADVIPALENILSLNGVAMTLVNGTYMVVPQDIAATALSTPMVSPSNRQLARGFGINVIPLNYVSATSMQEILEPFVGPGSLRADTARNILIYSGSGSEARDLLEMVRVFDVDWMRGMSFALFPVDVADVTTLVADLESVFLQDGTSPLAGLVRFVPIERLNAILAISPQSSYLEEAESWIDRLDRGIEGAGRRIFVYYVENGRASDLADILSQVFEGSGSERSRPLPNPLAPGLTPIELAAPPAPAAGRRQATQEGGEGEAPPQVARQTPRDRADLVREGGVGQAVGTLIEGGSEIRIIADEASNALLILSTSAEFRMIEATLKKLDVIPLQVLIEATIAEVGLSDELRYGLQWFFESGDFTNTFSLAADGAISSAFPGFSFLFDSGNQQAVLNALTTITDVEVISSPSLMVLDNQSARLQVGDQVPVSTQSSTSTTDPDAPIVNSIQQLDTGVVLEVTPRVNTGGLVVMEIVQEVSTPIATVTSGLDSPTIQQRRIESTVAVQSGETIALGGLIRDDQNETINGIPLLSDIPILGHLFKTTSETLRRTELLVLITPRVVRNQTDAQEVTEELRRRLKSIEPLEKRVYKVPKSAS